MSGGVQHGPSSSARAANTVATDGLDVLGEGDLAAGVVVLGAVADLGQNRGALYPAQQQMKASVDEVLAQATGTPSVGRPHVADALVANGTVADRAEACIS